MSGVRWGMARLCAESGSYSTLTADVLTIGCGMVKESPLTAALLPIACLVPFVTASNYIREAAFARYWRKRLEREWAWTATSPEEVAA